MNEEMQKQNEDLAMHADNGLEPKPQDQVQPSESASGPQDQVQPSESASEPQDQGLAPDDDQKNNEGKPEGSASDSPSENGEPKPDWIGTAVNTFHTYQKGSALVERGKEVAELVATVKKRAIIAVVFLVLSIATVIGTAVFSVKYAVSGPSQCEVSGTTAPGSGAAAQGNGK